MTQSEYRERQRQEALQFAPAREIDEHQFRALLVDTPIVILRRAGLRWSAARARSHEGVIDAIVAALQNPQVNQGDTYRIALGHIYAYERTNMVTRAKDHAYV